MNETFFVFRFDENVVPHRSIIVREDDAGLHISYAGESVLEVRQSVAGTVRLSYGEQPQHISADSFAELYEKHSAFVREQLLPLAKDIGLNLPTEGP